MSEKNSEKDIEVFEEKSVIERLRENDKFSFEEDYYENFSERN